MKTSTLWSNRRSKIIFGSMQTVSRVDLDLFADNSLSRERTMRGNEDEIATMQLNQCLRFLEL